MNTLILSEKMHVTHEFVLNIAVNVFNIAPDANGIYTLDPYFACVLEHMCEPTFIGRFTDEVKKAKRKDNNQRGTLIADKELSGFSSAEVGELLNIKNLQQISRMMRDNGYESKVIYLGRDHQGRRWLKVGQDNTVAKEEAANRYERAYQARKKPRKGYTPSFF